MDLLQNLLLSFLPFGPSYKGQTGVVTKEFIWRIDRPVPRGRSVNVYFSSNKGRVTLSNQDSLNRLIIQLLPIAPKHLAATVTISGGSGASGLDVSQERHQKIREFLEDSGFEIKNVVSEPGSANISRVRIHWAR